MRPWLGSLVVCASFFATAAPLRGAEVGAMPASEIEALEHRLADAKCYAGPFDGAASDALKTAAAACPTQTPLLRIETGMHVAPIKQIGVDRACTLLATGSDDKTVRLWSLPDGRLLRTLRVPVGDGDGGKIFTLALSPDGKLVAAGGSDARYDVDKHHGVYVFDAATGNLVTRVGAFGDILTSLAFAPDGRWLAAATDGKDLHVWDTATWADAFKANDAGYIAAFAGDGRLVTLTGDGKLRLFSPGPEFKKVREVTARGTEDPAYMSVDPSGQLLAVGFANSWKIDVYDAATLAFRFAADTKDVTNGDFGALAWLRDGSRMVAGGSFDRKDHKILKSFDRSGHGVGELELATDDRVSDIRTCGDGYAVSTANPALGLFHANGESGLWTTAASADMLDKIGDAFLIGKDAKSVRFGLASGAAKPVLFDLVSGSLNESASRPSGLLAASVQGLPVTKWKNETSPRWSGKPIDMYNNDIARSLAVRTDRAGFVLGTSFALQAFDSHGKKRWDQPTPGEAWGANLSADGHLVVAAYGDGTVRWHRWSDGRELLALFVNTATRAWVAWTPSGYYQASPGGEDMIGWHVNRGWDQAADFFPASRFRDQFNRPDVVALILDTLDEDEALRQANAVSKRHDIGKAVIERLPPVLKILSPAEGASQAPGTVEVRYSVRLPSGGTLDRVEAFVDGAKVEARGLARIDAEAAGTVELAEAPPAGAPPSTPDGSAGTITLPMPAHDAVISLVAYAGGLAGDPARVQLKGVVPTRGTGSAPQSDDEASLKPTLYALLVGVSHYANKDFDLAYPAKDATELADALGVQKGRLYKDVQVRVLTDADATSTAFKDGLLWLQKEATSRDLAIVFAAGHGTTDAKGKFWFLTTDADPKRLLSTAVSRDDIADVLFDLPGKKLLFLDACHSGAALNAGVRGLERTPDVSSAMNDFTQAEGGVVAYAAATGREFSFERDEWGHGAFTKALIEGLGGKADLLHKGTITTATLDAFLEDRVKELTDGQQHPVMTRPKTVPDFPIAMTP